MRRVCTGGYSTPVHYEQAVKLSVVGSPARPCCAVFLDYDGTISPIVKDPTAAFMSDEMRVAGRATRSTPLFAHSVLVYPHTHSPAPPP